MTFYIFFFIGNLQTHLVGLEFTTSPCNQLLCNQLLWEKEVPVYSSLEKSWPFSIALPKNFTRLELIDYINTLIDCIFIHNIHLKTKIHNKTIQIVSTAS